MPPAGRIKKDCFNQNLLKKVSALSELTNLRSSVQDSILEHDTKKERNSSIELLKIVAMAMIVLFHTVQTLAKGADSGCAINLGNATGDIQRLLLAMILYFGPIGNLVFFTCSAWFLLDSKRSSHQKILRMLGDVWLVSICILIIVLIIERGRIGGALILKQLFPTLFANNWYATCYILFLGTYPFLNRIIQQVSQRSLLRISLVLFFLYSLCDYFNRFFRHFFETPVFFFTTELIVWVAVYFIIAYMKLYLPKTSKNVRTNFILFAVGFFGVFGSVLLVNFAGRQIPLLDGMLLVWKTNCNPFILFMVIGAFNLMRSLSFSSKAINYVSKLTLFIYIIHENLLLRTLYRPAMWQYVILKYGDSHFLLLALCLAAIIFVFALAASVLYYHTLHKLVVKACARLYVILQKIVNRMEKTLLRLS